ncbi:MAG TPA: hypothetical protein VGR57_19675 [Ktedonobacterales bacterium]|nr:hypothetical protein [Ktedonobacterales bacterium]
MADAVATADQPARKPLRVSDTLAAWGSGLLVAGCAAFLLAVAALAVVGRAFAPAGLVVVTMIALSGFPVFLVVLWIVGRALRSSTAQFVEGVVATPLMALDPPPRPAVLAGPLATLRFLRLGAALVAGLLLVLVVAGADVAVGRLGSQDVRIGAYAVSIDGLAALAALLLALGWGVMRLGGALARRERALGARYFALHPAADGIGGAAPEVAVCAVPGEG